MNPEGVSSTVVLTGLMPFVIFVASVLSLPLALFLLRLYRRSVTSGMGVSVGNAVPSPKLYLQPPAVALVIKMLDKQSEFLDADNKSESLIRALTAPWRHALIYMFGGSAYALIMMGGWLLSTHDPSWLLIKLFALSLVYLWPAIIAVVIVAAYDSLRRWQVLGIYFGIYGMINALSISQSPDLQLLDLPLYWLLMNGLPTVFILAFLARPIRAVGVIVFTFMMIVTLGSQVLVAMMSNSVNVLSSVTEIGYLLGLNAVGVFVGSMLFSSFVFAGLAWLVLRSIGKRYKDKSFSDQSLIIDTIFLLFGIVQSIGSVFQGRLWILTGLLAFAGYKLVVAYGFWQFRREYLEHRPLSLLLLRVFRLGKRSEIIFDKLRKHWQSIGTINMIVGPDLVTAAVEPHEFLSFLSGGLSRQFVSGEEDLEKRLEMVDHNSDPDGRFRINEFFCRADTWQITMRRLAVTSDCVLMDLRSFSPSNQGCLFELSQLIDSVDIGRVIFLVDGTTDQDYLISSLQQLWKQTSTDSLNRGLTSPTISLFNIEDQSERSIHSLITRLVASPALAR